KQIDPAVMQVHRFNCFNGYRLSTIRENIRNVYTVSACRNVSRSTQTSFLPPGKHRTPCKSLVLEIVFSNCVFLDKVQAKMWINITLRVLYVNQLTDRRDPITRNVSCSP